MTTIETAISVNADGSAVLELRVPGNVSAGMHRAVVIVDEQTAVVEQRADAPLDLLPLPFEAWTNDCTFRREDLYGDDGR